MLQCFRKKKGQKGFTLIELLVVIAIIGILATIVLVSLGSARAKARDARRISDVKQMALLLEMEGDVSSVALVTCVLADALASTCTGPGVVSQFSNFSDPNGTTACDNGSTGVCDYSVSQAGGAAAAGTQDYQICFWLEVGSGTLPAGLNSIETGSVLVAGCS
jgi:prepilin-type N-terminal cleavage/methylation domain-containing protein